MGAWSDGWLDGFIACGSLMAGHRERYEMMRDQYLGAKAMTAEEERQMLQVIDERDAAEEALSQAYYLVIGRSPEWSNNFGHAEALDEIGDAVKLLKQATRK